MTETVELCAASLWSKWGFEDGDVLFNMLCDQEFIDTDDSEVLALCVEKYLVPLLPTDVKTYRIDTHHNPIRAEGWPDGAPAWAHDVKVEITKDQVFAIARALQP